jgi:hypothetical protein
MNEFELKVYKMRQYQKAYFKSRSNTNLMAAKQAEADVDKAIDELNGVKRPYQQDLFYGRKK